MKFPSYKTLTSAAGGLSGVEVRATERLMSDLENLIMLFLTLQGCRDEVSMTSAILLYCKTRFSKSLSCIITDYVHDIFRITEQDGEEKIPDNLDTPHWLNILRNVKDDWTLVTSSRVFEKFSKLLGLMVTVGLCESSNVTFSIGKFKVFEPDIKSIHESATGIMDAMMETSAFFIESVYMCLKDRSLKPLLYSTELAQKLDEEYSVLKSYWPLVQTGTLGKVTSSKGREVEEIEFIQRLEKLATNLRCIRESFKSSVEKSIFNKKLDGVIEMIHSYAILKVASGIRKQPYTILFHGGSSVGKTTLNNQLVTAMLESQDLSTDQCYRLTRYSGEQYYSGARSNLLVLNINDVCNEKIEVMKGNPIRDIIDIDNNQPFNPPMADVNEKGKVFIAPEIFTMDTNVKDLNAWYLSNCPYSVQRRARCVIHVRAKPEFQELVEGRPQGIDANKVARWRREQGDDYMFDDIWILTVERAVQPNDLSELAGYRIIQHNGKYLKDVGIRDVMQYLIDDFADHREVQKSIIQQVHDRPSRITKCGFNGCNQIRGFCDLHDNILVPSQCFEPHFGDEIVAGARSAASHVLKGVCTPNFEKDVSFSMMVAAKLFVANFDWLCLCPTYLLDIESFQQFLCLANARSLRNVYVMETFKHWFVWISYILCLNYPILVLPLCLVSIVLFLHWLCKRVWRRDDLLGDVIQKTYVLLLYNILLLICCFPPYSYMVCIVFGFYCFVRQITLMSRVKREFVDSLASRNSINATWRSYRDDYLEAIVGSCVVFAVIYKIIKVYRASKGFVPQGDLLPKTRQDIERRDKEQGIWNSVPKRNLSYTQTSRTSVKDDLIKNIKKNLFYGSVEAENGRKMVNVLFLRTCLCVVPKHYFDKLGDELVISCSRSSPNLAGGKFTIRVSINHSWVKPGSDLVLCYCPGGGSFKDLTRWFPMSNVPSSDVVALWRKMDGEFEEFRGLTQPGWASNGDSRFMGGSYTLDKNTFVGMCGAAVISHGKGCAIAGIHVGGVSDTKLGSYALLTLGDIEEAIEDLKTRVLPMFPGTSAPWREKTMGSSISFDKHLHSKSALHYMPINSQLQYHGSTFERVTSSSNMKVTPISESVTDICAVPNTCVPPKMKPTWFGPQIWAESVSTPAEFFNYDLLEKAVLDYVGPLEEIIREHWGDTKPLSEIENLNGMPGIRFIDAMKKRTATGKPCGGKKEDYMITLIIDGIEYTFMSSDFRTEVDFARTQYAQGLRMNYLANGCKKDEILMKIKCRMFFINFIVLVYLIRQYFLPIARILMMNPILSECAVGVNCHGPEWQQLHNRIFQFGSDSLLGGDYGKYDQKISSQMIIAAFKILIDFARMCDYNEEDISIMEALVSDVVFAYVVMEGDLVSLATGGHISGNPLTVIINSLVGSLQFRCAFFSMYPDLNFREVVALVTYGDDNAGSVDKSRAPNFNIESISKFFGKMGHTYTMPDKDMPLMPYLPPHLFEFLKRESKFIPEIGVHVGALNESSIFKSLHAFIRDKNCEDSEELACAKNIDMAIREFFNHGRDVYETRRHQLTEVANRNSIRHLCTMLEVDFDTMVSDWKSKYEFEPQMGDEVVVRPRSSQKGRRSANSMILSMLAKNLLHASDPSLLLYHLRRSRTTTMVHFGFPLKMGVMRFVQYFYEARRWDPRLTRKCLGYMSSRMCGVVWRRINLEDMRMFENCLRLKIISAPQA